MNKFERGAWLVGVAVLAMSLSVGMARAEHHSDDPFNRPGPYVGLGASWMVEGFQDRTASGDFGNSWGGNARFGYRLHEIFGLEGIYEYGDDFGAHQVVPEGARIRTHSFSVNGKLIVPVGRFNPYLMGGVGFLNADADRSISSRSNWDADGTSFMGRFGGGVDLWATENIALYVDAAYTIPVDEVSDLNHFSLGWGAKYAF
ncbi:MAG TPA: outer membrane beta-barrel protein [Candidatus Binatia bacterium]